MTGGTLLGASSVVLLMASWPSCTARADTEKFEGNAYQHSFSSELFVGNLSSITYTVCNNSDSPSDFFWSVAGFGISEDESLSGHYCLEREDYALAPSSGPPQSSTNPAQVFVLDKTAEVPTIFWCDFLGFSRCDGSVMGEIAYWGSTLREFARGGTDDPFVPTVLSVKYDLKDGRYTLVMEREEEVGQLIVVAKTSQFEGISLEQLEGTEAKFGQLGDFLPFTEAKLYSDLSPAMPALAIFSPAVGELGARALFQNATQEPVEISVIVSDETGIRLRLDTIALQPLR